MEPLGRLLHRRPDEGRAFSAAMVVATVSQILRTDFGFTASDARAISFRETTILIGVSHGIVAGRLQQQAAAIIDTSNAALQKLGAPTTYRLTSLRTRITSSP